MRKENLQQKIKRDAGSMEYIFAMIPFILLVPLLVSMLQLAAHVNSSTEVEDALAMSNLASAVIDLQEYGTSHNIVIKDIDGAYQIYRSALKTNLQLDAEGKCSNTNLIYGKVDILNYSVYNVEGRKVTLYKVSESGAVQTIVYENGLGIVKAPDDTLITTTAVYSQIGYPVESIMHTVLYGKKDNCADVVAE